MANPNWVKGVSGNPAGKAPGLKDKHTEIRDAFFAEFNRRGAKGLKDMATKDPTAFYKIVAGLLPKMLEADLKHSGALDLIHRIQKGRERVDS